jgi:2-amino-4-hydroxy-6-hydroxymethyldihydropteridine diphosphokinase
MTGLTPAYIGIGSNVDGPRQQVEAAFDDLQRLPRTRLIARSRLYATRPFGPVEQPDFVNAVAGVLTALTPAELLAQLLAVEAAHGRVREVHWGPRSLDLDLLVYGQLRLASTALTLPHPGIVERNFVLYPLADIAPDLDIPGLGRVSQLTARVSGEGIRVVAEQGWEQGR